MCRPKPNFIFRTWQVGQGEANSNTFITQTETTNDLVAVVHCIPIPHKFPHPDSVIWELTGSHKFAWTSKSTSIGHMFVCHGTAVGDPSDRGKHPSNGRQDDPMSVKIQFTAQYDKLEDVVISITLTQDQIDQMRQEYVDERLSIPARPEFVMGDATYYVDPDAGYGYMLDTGMADFHVRWIQECEQYDPEVHLRVTSGYRNPHHNMNHSGPRASATSMHMYGGALDVVGEGNITRQQIASAAKAVGATKVIVYDGHVHAQFAP